MKKSTMLIAAFTVLAAVSAAKAQDITFDLDAKSVPPAGVAESIENEKSYWGPEIFSCEEFAGEAAGITSKKLEEAGYVVLDSILMQRESNPSPYSGLKFGGVFYPKEEQWLFRIRYAARPGEVSHDSAAYRKYDFSSREEADAAAKTAAKELEAAGYVVLGNLSKPVFNQTNWAFNLDYIARSSGR